jgi:hypothetical protein
MLKLFLHSPSSEDVTVDGDEVAYGGFLAYEMFRVSLQWRQMREDPYFEDVFRSILDDSFHFTKYESEDFWNGLEGYFNSGSQAMKLNIGEKEIEIRPLTLKLNTALRMGNTVILLTRMFAQANINAFVSGINRNWLAKLIEDGIEDGILTQNVGWEDAIKLLRARDDEPIVFDCTTVPRFPSVERSNFLKGRELPPSPKTDKEYRISQEFYEEVDKEWKCLSKDEQWDYGFDFLCDLQNSAKIELKPEDWNDYYFDVPMNGFNFLRYLSNLRRGIIDEEADSSPVSDQDN